MASTTFTPGPQALTEQYICERYGHWNAGLGRAYKAARFGDKPLTADQVRAAEVSFVNAFERDTQAQRAILGEPALCGNYAHDKAIRIEAATVVREGMLARGS